MSRKQDLIKQSADLKAKKQALQARINELGGKRGYGTERNKIMSEINAIDKMRAQIDKDVNTIREEQGIRSIYEAAPKYESALGGEEYDYLREQAFGEGPLDAYKGLREQQEQWSQGEMDRIKAGLGQELGNIDVGRAGQLQNAYSSLAMGGGLSSGARERMAASSLEDSLRQRQQARFGASEQERATQQALRQSLLGIGQQEATTRLSMQDKIAQAIAAEKERKQRFELDRWREQAGLEAGLQKAKSQERIAEVQAPEEGK